MKVVCVIRAKKLKLLFVSLDGKEQIAKKVKNKINNLTCSNFIIRIIKSSNKLVFEKEHMLTMPSFLLQLGCKQSCL
jgi:hypothetical protein